MSMIKVADNLPGIVGLLAGYPSTGRPLRELAHQILFNDSPLTRVERELIAVTVSALNNCEFCARSHAAVVVALLAEHNISMQDVFVSILPEQPNITAPLQLRMSLTKIAMAVGLGIEFEKPADLTDQEIHDAVLTASAFMMFNCYVSSLQTENCPDEVHLKVGKQLAEKGYL